MRLLDFCGQTHLSDNNIDYVFYLYEYAAPLGAAEIFFSIETTIKTSLACGIQ